MKSSLPPLSLINTLDIFLRPANGPTVAFIVSRSSFIALAAFAICSSKECLTTCRAVNGRPTLLNCEYSQWKMAYDISLLSIGSIADAFQRENVL